MKHFFTITTVFLMISSNLEAQGTIEYVKDPRIDALIQKQGEIIPPATEVMIPGYRIQLYFDSNKSQIEASRSQFVKLHPKVETYIQYVAPNYLLKVGDFRTKLDADRLKAEIEAQFPTAFTVKEMVKLPRID